jgi:hypothetical protein
MELASFTIEFPEHVKAATRKRSLDLCCEKGASVEQLSDRVFKVVCSSPRVLAIVGWLLLQTSVGDSCRVISTSGGAEARASAYPMPRRHADP